MLALSTGIVLLVPILCTAEYTLYSFEYFFFPTIILIVLGIVIDVGLLSIEKRKIDNNTYDALEYYLDSENKDKTIKLIEDNVEDVFIELTDAENNVYISVNKKYKGIFNIIYDDNIEINYIGNKETKKIVKG